MANCGANGELDLIEPTDKERALERLGDIREEEQLKIFQRSFLACSKKFLNLSKEQLERFREKEMPEIGEVLAKKTAPWAALQRAAMTGLAALNVAVPVGCAYALHPIALLIAVPLGVTSLFIWKSIRSSDSLSYQNSLAGLKKQGGPESFPPKNLLLALEPDKIVAQKRPESGHARPVRRYKKLDYLTTIVVNKK